MMNKPLHFFRIITIIISLLFLFSIFTHISFTGSPTNLIGKTNTYNLELAFPGLQFNRPVDLQATEDGSNRIFVVEQAGIIFLFNKSGSAFNKSIFIDLTDRVNFGGEKGLLGLAFHPEFSTNGYFFVYYNSNPLGDSVIARYTIDDSDPNLGNKTSELIILTVAQPFSNHNGGQIAFGLDKYLYIALGDGGSGGDPLEHGQNRSTLIGSFLRIDIDNPANGYYYGIPIDNPFVGNVNNYREEIFAYGLRNPWRMSFDPVTGNLWTGDVGQSSREEINIIENGKNYGWDITEGNICYEPSIGCATTGLEAPIFDYNRSEGTTVIGGYVYRGPTLPSLVEKYIYADFGNGRIWALEYDGIHQTNNSLIFDANFSISAFGTDAVNELYILNYYDGDIYKFTAEIIPQTSSQQSSTSSQSQESTSITINTSTTDDSEFPPQSATFSGVRGFEIVFGVLSIISILVYRRGINRI